MYEKKKFKDKAVKPIWLKTLLTEISNYYLTSVTFILGVLFLNLPKIII